MAKSTAAHSDDWFVDMQRSFDAAKFQEAARTYDRAIAEGSSPSNDAQLLRARTLLKEDEKKAAAFLVSHKLATPSRRQSGLWSLYLGIAYARMGDFQSADHHFLEAQSGFETAADFAQLAYHQARRLLLEGRYEDARRTAELMRSDTSEASAIDLELLQSFILSHEERYVEEAQSLIKALRKIGNRRSDYLEQRFHATQNLAILGREIAFSEAGALSKHGIDSDLDWPEDFLSQRFQALKAVGWTQALQGDMLGCFRYLRAAEQVAPTDAFRAIVLLDRAHFARIIGEGNWANDELAAAESMAERVNWDGTNGEERIGLLLLAERFAELDQEKARYYLARYAALDRIRSPLHLLAFDHRIEAYAAYADGIVRLAARDPGAEESLRKSWIIFDRIGYDWRAGRAALRIYSLTRKDRWLHLAEDKLESYAKSWLGEELRLASAGLAARVSLPPMQSKVFKMLCQQKTTDEIAEALGLSPHTIRNHLKAVFKAYGVNNRSALIAEAAKRGEMAK